MAIVLTMGVLLLGLLISAYAVFAPAIADLFSPEDDIKFVPRTLFAKSLLIFATTTNCPDAKAQRQAMQSILPVFLKNNFRIYEIYGGFKPCCNGAVMPDLNGSLLRRCFNLDPGFHLIYVNDRGQHQFQSTAPLDSHLLIQLTNLSLNSALAQLRGVDTTEEQVTDCAVASINTHNPAPSQLADRSDMPVKLDKFHDPDTPCNEGISHGLDDPNISENSGRYHTQTSTKAGVAGVFPDQLDTELRPQNRIRQGSETIEGPGLNRSCMRRARSAPDAHTGMKTDDYVAPNIGAIAGLR